MLLVRGSAMGIFLKERLALTIPLLFPLKTISSRRNEEETLLRRLEGISRIDRSGINVTEDGSSRHVVNFFTIY